MSRLALLCLLAPLCLSACVDPDLRRGRDALGQGRYAEAIASFERAQARLPASEAPKRALASAHRARAMQRLDEGDCRAARGHFEVAEELTWPVLVDYQALLECTRQGGATPEEEVADLDHLVALGDTRVHILHRLMELELARGRDDEAVRHMAALEARFALTLVDRQALSRALLSLGRSEEAIVHLRHIVAADPGDPLARLKLAELEEERGRPQVARDMYDALARDFATNPVVHLRRAACCKRAGDEICELEARAAVDRLQGVRRAPPRKLRPLRKSRR